MRFVLKLLAVVVVGTTLGVAATLFSAYGFSSSLISDGPWKADLLAGSMQAGPYRRAALAVHGLFALNRSESIYYTAGADSNGVQLDGDCHYEVIGREPEARWWSITACGPDDYLIPNPAHRYSVSKASVVREGDGTIRVQVGGETNGVNWIPTGRKRFSIVLRLYNPGSGVVTNPAQAALPALTKVGCT